MALLEWFAVNRRALPWRDEPTPYRVLVSEYMLQQTQVATVLPYFSRFMEAFPTLEALAAAEQDAVLKLWEGLGYYSRARHLHQCARKIVELGHFPSEPDELVTLPGVGRYTAAAIASIAFGKRFPVVDGNVLRIRARMKADDTPAEGDAVKTAYYEELLGVIEGISDPSYFNQAMMELGALVCHPSNPLCGTCPVSGFCKANAQGNPLDYPKKKARTAVPHYHVAVALIFNEEGRFLIQQRSEEQMLGGLWEFPGGKLEEGETPEQAALREVREETGLAVEVERPLTVVRHAYSHFKITMHAFVCRLLGPMEDVPSENRPRRWILPSEIPQYAFPKANHKIFEALR